MLFKLFRWEADFTNTPHVNMSYGGPNSQILSSLNSLSCLGYLRPFSYWWPSGVHEAYPYLVGPNILCIRWPVYKTTLQQIEEDIQKTSNVRFIILFKINAANRKKSSLHGRGPVPLVFDPLPALRLRRIPSFVSSRWRDSVTSQTVLTKLMIG